MTTRTARRRPGEIIPAFQLETLSHGTLTVPGPGLTLLQFRRFAGCPVCNLHLRSFARGQGALQAAGVRSVAFFHSPAEQMRPYQGDLPFAVVPDAGRRWYRQFGVERSLLAVARPGVLWAGLKGLVLAPSNPLAGGSEQAGLPADFLVDERGELLAVHYGAHANDQWTVEQLLALARERGPRVMIGY